MASANTLSDNGALFGSTDDITIDGVAYVCRSIDHSLPVAGDVIRDSSGLFKGGGYTRGQETINVEIDAIDGVAAPSQLVPFSNAFHGYSAKYWIVTNLQIKSSQTGLRTYSATLVEHKEVPA